MSALTVLSNLALLVPAVVAYKYNRILRCSVLILETIVSSLYHLCDYSGNCLFPFQTLHYFDFSLAQLLIVLSVLYLIDFDDDHLWLEWVMIFISGCIIVILQVSFSGELAVQAGVVGVCALIVVVYWLVWGVPKYRWEYFAAGITLVSASSMFYAFQGVNPGGYWAIHSLWHIAGAMGIAFLFFIRDPKQIRQNAAAKISYHTFNSVK
jgi:hypothetical protein